MKRGDVVTVVASGDHGKPRPAIIVQADDFGSAETVLVCLCTSDVDKTADYRVRLDPTPANGLRKPSLIQTDKIHAVVRTKCGGVVGRLTDQDIEALNTRLTFVLGLGQ